MRRCPPGTTASFRWHYSANGSAGSWSGTQPAVYQGSIAVPDLCGGGQLRLNQGGTFTANVS